MSAPDYYDRVNPDLLKLIPPDAKVVLEIGCGAGALCEAYRRVNPGVEWYGVESNHEAIKIAVTRSVTHISDDAAGIFFMCPKSLLSPGADCLIFGDVLEHLVDPLAVLKSMARYVASGAQVLASIPNVQHWTVIRDLLDGKLEYTAEGLMDRTHLRFFTRLSIEAMFKAAGLHIFEIRGRDIANEGFEAWLAESGVKPRKEMRAYQYIIRSIKPTIGSPAKMKVHDSPAMQLSAQKLHIHAVLAEQCCARPRILEPFAAMETVPGIRCTSGMDGSYPASFDILIEQRFRHIDFGCQRLHLESGRLIIGEIDDDPTGLVMPHPKETLFGDPVVRAEPLGDIHDWLRSCHAIQVSTEPLAEVIREFNPNVMVFENQIAELPPFQADDTSGGTPNAGIFFGAQNREDDWQSIMPAINRIANDPSMAVWFEVIHDRRFFDALETTAKRFHPFLPYDHYRSVLRSCDIALLPLEPNRFNKCKSDIKFLECAAEGVAALAAWTVYKNRSNYGRTSDDWRILLYVDSDDFDSGLRLLIRDSQLRLEIAQSAYAYVRDHRLISQHYRTRLDWYRSLLRSKEALDGDLLKRVPQLAQHAPAMTPP